MLSRHSLCIVLLGIVFVCNCGNRVAAQPPLPPDAPPGFDPARGFPADLPPEARKNLQRMFEHHAEQMRQMRARMLQERGLADGLLTPQGAGVLGRLGARVDRPSATLVEQLDLPRGQGLVLGDVKEGGAAAKAGLKSHDILLELDGKAVPNGVAEFAELLATIKEGKPVNVLVLRKGKNETIKGLSLPKAEAAPAFVAPEFAAPLFPLIPPPVAAVPGAPGFPPLGGDGVMTSTFRSNDRFVARHQEGSLIITLVGKAADGKAAVEEIRVQDGRDSNKYSSVDKIPEEYRLKVKSLVEMTEKSQARIDVKKP